MMDEVKEPGQQIDRRTLLKVGTGAFGVAAGAFLIGCGGSAGLSSTGTATASTATGSTTGGTATDDQLLNFILNMEMIKAEYYLLGATGTGIDSADAGTGAGTTNGGRLVTFATVGLNGLAANLAADELLHVQTLRAQIGTSAIAKPAIDFTNAFNTLGQATSIGTFDAFANEENFFLGAYYFEDIAVTLQTAAIAAMTSATNITLAQGVLGVDCYHAGAVRYALFTYSSDAQAKSSVISTYRATNGNGADEPIAGTTATLPTIAPHDTNGLAFQRTSQFILNLMYLSATTTPGGFFPNGMNGTIPAAFKRRATIKKK